MQKKSSPTLRTTKAAKVSQGRLSVAEATYEDFLQTLKLRILSLDAIAARIDREAYWRGGRDKGSLVREINATYQVANHEDLHFDVVADYRLDIFNKSRKSALSVQSKYSAHFHFGFDVSPEMADRFAQTDAKVVIWPYFRQLVSDTTARMHVPPLLIPLALESN
jgi:Preprotein translocase subunit SecB